jgi:retron-type reverse transcriptase
MSVFTKQQRIAELARRSPQMGFTSLAYLMDIDWLKAAFHRTRKDGAPGVDGQTWSEYERNLEANLQSLLDRAKSATYRAPPVRRVYIPKAGSATETRPIGIPTLEDKVLQRGVVMLLEPIDSDSMKERSSWCYTRCSVFFSLTQSTDRRTERCYTLPSTSTASS